MTASASGSGADRLARIHAHLRAIDHAVYVSTSVPAASSPDPDKLATVLPPEAKAFLATLADRFRDEVRQLHLVRQERQLQLDLCSTIDEARSLCVFRNGPYPDGDNWTINPLPQILRDRRVDIGDTSPARTDELVSALNSGAQGVQVDMDDGHCPSWKNVIHGHWNLLHAVRGKLPGITASPALLLPRPRAWNMDEENVLVNGHVMPGALFDFGVHMFHSGAHLTSTGRGPFFYLPKLESADEAALWTRIFAYTEATLGIPQHTIKAVVLIEHILAAFEMDAILFAMRHYSAGLNCGMWDYTASILSKFRAFPEASLPDRQAFVSMQTPFLSHYMHLLIATCKKRQAPATTGMAPFVLAGATPDAQAAMRLKTTTGKTLEARAGADGALVFDPALVPLVQDIFATTAATGAVLPAPSPRDLLVLPQGHVTLQSVEFNLRVVLAYIESWVRQEGIAVLDNCVEDSATAEIARSQLWHWIKYQQRLQDSNIVVSLGLIHSLLGPLVPRVSPATRRLALHVLQVQGFPTFLTTFLQHQRLVWE
ncbi:malate synthase [Achlya hypogyna]|uniref:malate synthase n=1 Tax=Achlya hypogyna TaxID=1202772 RepID=A0A1V9ZT38_ACHHY|nr:malate synthase [Achlya hypogyna]